MSAFDDGSAAALSAGARVRIKNGSGYLLEIGANITDNHAIITSGQLAKLPVGNYLLELWDTIDGGTAIYPSDGFLALQINENVTGLSGGLVSSITVDDFVQQFSDLSQQLKKEVSDAVANGLKGDKGDTGPQGEQGPQGVKGDKGDKGDKGTVDNAGLISAPAFQSLQNQVNNSAVGTNLLTGTSNVLTTNHNATGWGFKGTGYSSVEALEANQTYTLSCYLEPAEHDVAICIHIAPRNQRDNGNVFGTTVAAGSKGISTITITLTPEDIKVFSFWIIFTHKQKDSSAVSYKGFKLEKGNKATDWCPNSAEILTQSDYAKIKAAIVALGGSLS